MSTLAIFAYNNCKGLCLTPFEKGGGIFVFLFISFMLCSSAQAALYMEIRGGQVQGLPIAIFPFQGEEILPDQAQNLSAVIRADLQNSGQFSVMTASKLQALLPEGQVNLAVLKQQGMEDLLKGRVQKIGSQYTVEFELLDVLKQAATQPLDAQKNSKPLLAKPLLAMRFDSISGHQLRALAHHISDLVFEKLIGIKGFFSTRIAYVSVVQGVKSPMYTLEVADFDGHAPKPLYRSAYPIMSPAWSPDAQKIAFVSFDKDRASINVVDVMRAHVQKLTQFPGINGAPSWSPDGQSLALVLSKEGSPKIYTLNLANKHLHRMTDGSSRDTEPVFSPDGRSIYFTSDRGGKPQIYRVQIASGQIERVTFIGSYNAKPSITPDGKRLVTLHRAEGGGLFSIALQSLTSGELKILTSTGLNDSPTVAPNGMMVLYGSGDGRQALLNAVSLDGGTRIVLPAQEAEIKDPAWSPFPARH